jgi:hypothetical protein
VVHVLGQVVAYCYCEGDRGRVDDETTR